MRCFIGIELPKNIKDNLYEIQQKLVNEHAKINFVHKKNIHLTLKFLGELNEEQLKLTRMALNNVKHNKFSLSLSKFGWFSNKSQIRVLFVDVSPIKEVMELQDKIEDSLGSLFEKDNRFNAHLTIGRDKSIKNYDKFMDILKEIEVKWDSFSVDSFSLIKSVLSEDGPKYTTLEKYSLV